MRAYGVFAFLFYTCGAERRISTSIAPKCTPEGYYVRPRSACVGAEFPSTIYPTSRRRYFHRSQMPDRPEEETQLWKENMDRRYPRTRADGELSGSRCKSPSYRHAQKALLKLPNNPTHNAIKRNPTFKLGGQLGRARTTSADNELHTHPRIHGRKPYS